MFAEAIAPLRTEVCAQHRTSPLRQPSRVRFAPAGMHRAEFARTGERSAPASGNSCADSASPIGAAPVDFSVERSTIPAPSSARAQRVLHMVSFENDEGGRLVLPKRAVAIEALKAFYDGISIFRIASMRTPMAFLSSILDRFRGADRSSSPVAPPPDALRGAGDNTDMVALVYQGATLTRLVPIAGKLTVGRGRNCDVVLDDLNVSREHCVIRPTATGISVADLRSRNGTHLNGVRVELAGLAPGDELRLGQATLKLIRRAETENGDLLQLASVYRDVHTGLLNYNGLQSRINAWSAIVAGETPVAFVRVDLQLHPGQRADPSARLEAAVTIESLRPVNSCAARIGCTFILVLLGPTRRQLRELLESLRAMRCGGHAISVNCTDLRMDEFSLEGLLAEQDAETSAR